MDIGQLLGETRDALTVKRVYGDAYERDGTVVVPVARVAGGGGGGEGRSEEEGQGSGGGFGLRAEPVGVYVIRDGQVRWEPAVDVNRIVLGLEVLALALLVVLRTSVKRRRKRRKA